MESFFSTVKVELGEHFERCGEARMALFDYIEVFYNQRRRHSMLDARWTRGAKAKNACVTQNAAAYRCFRLVVVVRSRSP